MNHLYRHICYKPFEVTHVALCGAASVIYRWGKVESERPSECTCPTCLVKYGEQVTEEIG